MSFSIRAKLLAAFALDLVLMIILGYVATQQMALMNDGARSLTSHTLPSLASVAALREQVNAYKVNQLEFILYQESEADKARSKRLMGEVEQEVARIFAEYRPLISSATEAERFAAVEQAWQRLVDDNYQRYMPDAVTHNTGAVRPFYSRLNPLYLRVATAIDALDAESRSQADQTIMMVEGAYQTARGFILLDTLMTLVISAAIGLILSARIAARLGRLASAADKVAAGDLERTVAVESRDELGQMAMAFNQMVAGLRAQRRALEERNDALRRSLVRQEQLTEDLIRRRQAEEVAHQAQAAAEAASQAKSMFLATMSHELRTPLNAILGYAQLLRLAGSSHSSQFDVDPLERILVAGRHLTTLINNVLDFSKIEQGIIDLHIVEVAVCAVAREVADVVTPLVQRHHNELRLDCPSDLGVMYTDTGRVRQVLLNLLGNAAKFTEGGVITLRASREAAEAGGEEHVRFDVSDTGIGIAPEDLGRLFQPFSQVDSSVTRRYEGTGLGLALSRQLCIALGGTISVASQPGQGTTFTVRLPVGVLATSDSQLAIADSAA